MTEEAEKQYNFIVFNSLAGAVVSLGAVAMVLEAPLNGDLLAAVAFAGMVSASMGGRLTAGVVRRYPEWVGIGDE